MKMQSSNKNYISTIDIGLSGDEAERLTEEHYCTYQSNSSNSKIILTYQSKIQCQFNLLCFFCIFNSFRTLKKDSKEFKRKKSSSIKVWYFNIYKILDEKIRTEFKLPPLFIGIHLYTRTTNSLSRKFSNSNLTHILSWKKKRTKATHLISTGLVLLVLILRLSLLLSPHLAHGSICGKLDCYFEHDKAGVLKLNNDMVYFERFNIVWRFWTEAIWTNWRECCVSFQFHSESVQMLRASSFENVSTKLLNKPFNK